jgi:hypothetical protein
MYRRLEREQSMSIEQAPSILIGIGASAFAIGLLYGLQLLVEKNDADSGGQMEHLRASRRLAAQQRIEALKRAAAEGASLFSPDIERATQTDTAGIKNGKSTAESSERGFRGERSKLLQLESAGDALPKSIGLDMTVEEEIVQ